jgi:apolipoprotein N-acyltransferase
LQFASLFGILGLSFWVILTNLAVYKKKWKPAAALAIIPYIFGFSYTSYHQPKLDQSPVLKGALVQTALLPSQKLYLEHKSYDFISPYEQWSRIAHLLSQVKEKVDLVVLPESAVALNDNTPFYSRQRVVKILQTAFKTSAEAISALGPQVDRVSNRFWMNALTKIIQSDIVMGIDTEDHGHYFSSALFSSYERNQTQKYDKQLLLPLAEYLPFESLRSLTAMYGITDFFTPGKEVMIFQSKVPLSASICYEETFGHILRKGRKKGARLFVNLTNDNWYPSSRLPKQHFDLARVHTVANGTPLLRACNAGVTSSLDSLGQVIGQLNDWNQPAVLVTTVPLYQIKTLYAMWGDAGIVSLSIFILGVLLFINRKSIFVRID